MTTTQLTRDALLLALEKHGLPIWGTDAELQVRYDRNELGGKKPQQPVEPKSFRGRPKGSGASKIAADEPELENKLLANKASAVEVTSDNVNED